MSSESSDTDTTTKKPSKITDEVKLRELTKKRGIIKGRLTLFAKCVNSFTDIKLSGVQKADIKLRMQTAKAFFDDFNNVQGKIELLVNTDEQSQQLESRELFEEQYFSTMAKAECMLNGGENTQASNCTQNDAISKSCMVKLPTISLPVFDGSYDQWLEFRDTYLSLIHNSNDIGNIQKFHYLRSALTGNAIQIIKSLEFTASNYTIAWDLLENRFNNNRLLVHNHVKALFNLNSLTKESPSQIRKLIDTTLRNLRTLHSLGEPTDHWDTLIIYIIVSKLDASTEREWENYKSTNTNFNGEGNSKLKELLKYLSDRADMLELIKTNNSKNSKENSTKNQASSQQSIQSYVSTNTNKTHTKQNSTHTQKRTRSCHICNNNHAIYACSQFLNLSVHDRLKIVEDKKLCQNCLRAGHTVSECVYGPCKQCYKRHNSLIHIEENNKDASLSTQPSADSHTQSHVSAVLHTVTHSHYNSQNNENINTHNLSLLQPVLLSTALVDIADNNNEYHTARCLLDSGSQHCFIAESLCKTLKLPFIQSTLQVTGVGHTVTQATQSCVIQLRSKTSSYNTQIQCLVLPCITATLPSNEVDVSCIQIPDNLTLADPFFHLPSHIDLLIGADLFWELLYEGRIRMSNGPYLQNSKLGWLISGPVNTKNLRINQVQCNFTQTLDTQLKNFWLIEEIPTVSNVLSKDERECENLFVDTTTRDNKGQFSVRIPLRESAAVLGDSYSLALNRFLSLERKFNRLPDFKRMYCEFMREYLSLGHMTRVKTFSPPYYFLPHHGVIREQSTTTKLRVVFDASACTTTGKSLNNIQHTGPTLQNDLFSILLRFRQYKYVACADVEKFFRCVQVQPDHRSLQLIIWRENSSDDLGIYQLNTVTYGTASAPYLSIRCLNQLASECQDELISRVIREDFYVDDLVTGADDETQLKHICHEVSNVLSSGGFSLRKWVYNKDTMSSQNNSKELSFGENSQCKTLGLGWFNHSDELHFTTKIHKVNDPITKRIMLSIISQIFDPLGLLSPAVIVAKILLQKLWLCKIGWDDPVPNDVLSIWNKFINKLHYLQNIRIPRHVLGPGDCTQNTELHIFTDASQNAYGASAYVRTYSDSSLITVRLLCAKSKVAPLKPLSIPRLELCGALVGAKLYDKIHNSLRLSFTNVLFWTDSTIVLGWLRMSPNLLKTFVQNRVVEINEITNSLMWLHVNGKDNPADLLSRGLELDVLSESGKWWEGPRFLHEHNNDWSSKNTIQNSDSYLDLPEIKLNTTSMVCKIHTNIFDFARYSCLNRLQRSCAYVLRFIKNTRIKDKTNRALGPLLVDELNESMRVLLRFTQTESFPTEHNCLSNDLPLKTKPNISSLNIFLDSHNLIRVGGRLENSTSFSYDKKHPILLCSKHYFTQLLFRQEHKRLIHAGPQLLLSTVREQWWPLGGRNLAKKTVYQCVTCTRLKGNALNPIMGNLPSERLDPGFPFLRCGVDYAGPLFILNRKGRGAKLEKCYICVFICFITHAMHLEVVSSLTTEAYMLSLKRFISRRGKPAEIFSDNGKNFVGAAKEFTHFLTNNSRHIIEKTANDHIKSHLYHLMRLILVVCGRLE